jgi:hypothetical protein
MTGEYEIVENLYKRRNEGEKHRKLKLIAIQWLKENFNSKEICNEYKLDLYSSETDTKIINLKNHPLYRIETEKKLDVKNFSIRDIENLKPLEQYLTEQEIVIWNKDQFIGQGKIVKRFLKLWLSKKRYFYKFKSEKLKEEFIKKHIKISFVGYDNFSPENYHKIINIVKGKIDNNTLSLLKEKIKPYYIYSINLFNVPAKIKIEKEKYLIPENENKLIQSNLIIDIADTTNKIAIECGTVSVEKLKTISLLGWQTYWLNYKGELHKFENNNLKLIQTFSIS